MRGETDAALRRAELMLARPMPRALYPAMDLLERLMAVVEAGAGAGHEIEIADDQWGRHRVACLRCRRAQVLVGPDYNWGRLRCWVALDRCPGSGG